MPHYHFAPASLTGMPLSHTSIHLLAQATSSANFNTLTFSIGCSIPLEALHSTDKAGEFSVCCICLDPVLAIWHAEKPCVYTQKSCTLVGQLPCSEFTRHKCVQRTLQDMVCQVIPIHVYTGQTSTEHTNTSKY